MLPWDNIRRDCMTVCIDYDGSYHKYLEFFQDIIAAAKKRGYQVILATMRYFSEVNEDLRAIEASGIPVYYTCRIAKQIYLEQTKGIIPDIWIDDNPEWIVHNAL
jgi:hypothetical protein